MKIRKLTGHIGAELLDVDLTKDLTPKRCRHLKVGIKIDYAAMNGRDMCAHARTLVEKPDQVYNARGTRNGFDCGSNSSVS